MLIVLFDEHGLLTIDISHSYTCISCCYHDFSL